MTIVADIATKDARVLVFIWAIEAVDVESLAGMATESRFIRGSDAVHTTIVDSIIRQTDEIVGVH